MIKKAVILSLFFILISCGGQGTPGVGTSTGNPSVPQQIIPDFQVFISEQALGDNNTTGGSLTAYYKPSFVLSGPASQWEALFLQGGINDVRVQRTNVEQFGDLISTALNNAGITTATDTIQTVSLTSTNLITTQAPWTIQIRRESSTSEFIRLYFINTDTNEIQGTYVFITDSNGDPVRGLFAYVQPDTLSATAGDGKRLAAFAFDFTDPSENLLVMRVDQFHLVDLRYYVYHVHYECNTNNDECLGEYLEINTPEPTRTFTHTIRFSWNDTTNVVCIADVTYAADSITLGTTQSFTGPSQPTEADVTDGSCTIRTPFWGSHVYTEADLPFRFNDTDPVGGTALMYFVDGSSKTGWDLLTPDLIDTWLDASDFD